MKKFGFVITALILWVVLVCVPVQTLARSTSPQAWKNAASFYKGKTVEFVVPYTPGGTYDTAARLLTPFLAKNLGARVIVKNEPGAGGKVALNRLAKETNGLSLIALSGRAAILPQVFGEAGVRFDLAKFNWLGTVSKAQYLMVLGQKSGYKSISDLQQAKQVKFAAGSGGGIKAALPLVMGYTLGVNVKVITGYKGSSDDILALLRGEVDGVTVELPIILPYIKSQDVLPFFVISHERWKLIPNLPTIYEVKKLSAKEKRIADISIALDSLSRPVATTPNVPKERGAFLESALKKTLEEPEVLKRFETILGESIDYASGKETAEAINSMLSLKGEEKALFGKLLGVEGY